MKLIVGLGNPGKEYENTRHSVGFEIINNFKTKCQMSNVKCQNFVYNKKFNSDIMEGEYDKEKIILIKPQTFMNNSGEAVKKIIDYYKLNVRDLYVVCDDLDLELGQIRIRKDGSSGGHKGLQSIIDKIGNDQFVRFRVGISRESRSKKTEVRKTPAEKYVLQKFSKDEQKIIDKAIDKTTDLIVESLQNGIVEQTVNL